MIDPSNEQANGNREMNTQAEGGGGPDAAIEVSNLSQSFGSVDALQGVDLNVATGCVFGLLGLNGAGKTTLLRHLLGLHHPLTGHVRVLGQDPIADREQVMRRIGYLSEEDSLPTWMRVGDLIRFCETIYPTWDRAYAAELCESFELSPKTDLKSLSKGGRARAGLIAAIAHKPELLILDEPGSGLDPIARDDILAAIIRTVSVEGRTVVFSSHLLDEVQRVCDHVAILHRGKIIESLPMESVDDFYEEWIVRPPSSVQVSTVQPPADVGAGTLFPGVVDWRSNDDEVSVLVDRRQLAGIDSSSQFEAIADPQSRLPPDWQWVETRRATLKRLFSARVASESRTGGKQEPGANSLAPAEAVS